ncbi:hypothetical protein AQUCO_00700906v1 [Aquilegia coerulea]|uniref:F-box domain-containing protein n=1 Tax=Aquilegia coerulea TaxID=218851 RepID=A0A2G5EM66_AQUCA|nr:hypothetical protein AQUCO_00700906v1 [Aquilegia coerulea]
MRRSRSPNPYHRGTQPPRARIRSEDENHINFTASSSSKRLKTYHGGGNDGIDRISELPDVLLQHILSFIDMEEVIRNTSLLSKRWCNLWISLPILNFNHYSMRQIKQYSFTKFVDRVLLRRDNSVINSLRIWYHRRHYGSMRSIEDWMSYAARKNVEQVCLDFYSHCKKDDEILPWPKLSKIQVFDLRARELLIPHSVFLDTQLKSLKLELVRLPEGNLTLSCSVLEKLTISYCDHSDVKLLNICAPKLNTLELKNDHDYNDTCKLRISTPNLKSLLLKGSMYMSYSFNKLSSLVKAKFECYEVPDVDIMRKILGSLNNATTLELCGELLEFSVRSPHQLLDIFVNLKCLKLIGWSGGSSMLHSLLMNSYSIETLVLDIDHVLESRHDWRELFQCIYRLKSIEIKGVRGCENELNLFEFILKNAVVLEDFTIYGYESLRCNSREELAKFNMKIHSVPRASSSVKILVFF